MRTSAAAAAIVVAVGFAAWLWAPDLDRATLERAYLVAPDGMLTVLGSRVHVRDTGPRSAPVVVLMHGFGSSLQTWGFWAERLEADHRVIRFDLPGAGLSEPDPTGDYTDVRSLAVLLALLDRLGVARASVVGNSIGGRIAWKFAAAYPKRVNRLVLVSPDGFSSPGFAYGQRPHIPPAVALMRYVLPKVLVRRNLAFAYAQPGRLSETVVARYYDLLRAPGVRDALIERMRQTVLEDPLPYLRMVRAPTLLLWGEMDRMIPIANAADYLRAIPDVRLVALADAGHVPQEEIAEASLLPVKAFLDHD